MPLPEPMSLNLVVDIALVDEYGHQIHAGILTNDTLLVAPTSHAWTDIGEQYQKEIDYAWRDDDTKVAIRFTIYPQGDNPSVPNGAWLFDDFTMEIHYVEDDGDSDNEGTDTGEGGGTGGGEDDVDHVPPGGTDPRAVCEELLQHEGATAMRLAPWACGWALEQRYYISLGGRTLCYDTVNKEWTDTGYGALHQVVTTEPTDRPPTMLFTQQWYQPTNLVPGFNTHTPRLSLLGAHRELNHNDEGCASPWAKEIILGGYDGIGPDRSRLKRAVRLRVWGSISDLFEEWANVRIGTLRFVSDGGYAEEYPIITYRFGGNGQSVASPDTLVDQQFTTGMIGRVWHAHLWFHHEDNTPVRCVSIGQSMLEYIPIA